MKTKGMISILSMSLVLFFIFSHSLGFAQTTYIVDQGGGGDFTSIQDCINAASDHDTCQVNAGSYVENIDFLGKAIAVRSENGPETTVIDGNQADAVVTFASGEGNDTMLEGFLVTNAGLKQGISWDAICGIYCENASPVIRGNRISNSAYNKESTLLVGIWVDGGSPSILENKIVENLLYSGYGIGCGGAGIFILESEGPAPVIISRNEILHNGALCTLLGVEMLAGVGIAAGYQDHSECESIVIQNNMIAYNAGGAGLLGSDIVFTHNSVIGGTNGGILIEQSNSAVVLNNIVAQNGSSEYASEGFCIMGSGGVEADYNDVWDNYPDNYCYASAPGPHDISEDPLFVNSGTLDFHLQEGSPCINRGTDAGVTDDIDGETRPQGNRFDIGADETPYGVQPWAAASTVGGGERSSNTDTMNYLFLLVVPVGFIILWKERKRRG